MKRSLTFIVKGALIALLKQFVRLIAYLWPRDRNLVAIGAWCGDRYCDSPMYFSKYLLEKTDMRVVWIGKKCVENQIPIHPRMAFREMGSFAAAMALLRAGSWICCISTEWDLSWWPLEGFAKLINTCHGFGIKKTGNKTGVGIAHARKATFGGRIIRFLNKRRRPWATISGPDDVDMMMAGDAAYFHRDRMLRIGTPSNDYLLHAAADGQYIMQLRKKYAELLGFDPAKKIILYLPTWRESSVPLFSFDGLNEAQTAVWRDMLDASKAVIVEKLHPRMIKDGKSSGGAKCIICISKEMQPKTDVQELMLAADILVSDYSGAFHDYGQLKRPCAHFMYDLDDYLKNGSGLTDGWENMIAGPVIKSEDELFKWVQVNLNHPKYAPAPGFADTCKYQTGRACEQLLEFIRK